MYIYGCGIYGKAMCDLLESIGVEVKGYVVSDDQAKPDADRDVKFISDILKSRYIIHRFAQNQGLLRT